LQKLHLFPNFLLRTVAMSKRDEDMAQVRLLSIIRHRVVEDGRNATRSAIASVIAALLAGTTW
jgi:hypothetical protein